jgi:hypothetical protein
MLAIWQVRKHVVAPRMGVVRLSQVHKRKLVRFNVVLLVVNLVALALGIAVALRSPLRGQGVSLVLGLLMLTGFGLAGFLLGFRRL